MNIPNLSLTTNMFAAFLLLILICFDCSLSDNTSPIVAFIKSSKSMDGRIHNWRNRNLLHIDSSTQLTSTERDSPSTSVAPEQRPKSYRQSLFHYFLSNISSIGTLPTPNGVPILKLVGNGSGEYDYLDEFSASHQIFEIITVSLRPKHPSQNSNKSFGENDSSSSSSSVPPTFKLTDDKIEQISGTEENGTAQLFNCSDISLNVTDQEDIRMKNLKLKIKYLSRPGVSFTLCRIDKEEKIIQTSLPSMGIIMSIFTYNFVSLFCAWVFIISVFKFFMLYIVSNIITYFLICMMLTGSITEVIIYFLPFHLNFMFILVTGWINLMSCKCVCWHLTKLNFFRIVNSNVVGNVFRMFQLTMTISLFMSLLDVDIIQEMTSFMNTDILDQEVYFKLMDKFTHSIFIVSIFVFGNFLVRVTFRVLSVFNSDFQIDCDLFSEWKQNKRYFYYYLFSLLSWFFGFSVIGLHWAFPQFWHLYLFVAALLTLSFLIDCITRFILTQGNEGILGEK